MIYDIYISLTPGIGWSKKKSLSEQLREEKRALEATAARQKKKDVGDRKRLNMLKREKVFKSRKPDATLEEMDAMHTAARQQKIAVTDEEKKEQLRRLERRCAADRKRRQLKKKEKNQCQSQN